MGRWDWPQPDLSTNPLHGIGFWTHTEYATQEKAYRAAFTAAVEATIRARCKEGSQSVQG